MKWMKEKAKKEKITQIHFMMISLLLLLVLLPSIDVFVVVVV